MHSERDWQVLIIGAGPTGLMLACELRLMGVDVAVVEKRSAGTGESRAPGINARTMEILGQRGLADRFRAKGRALSAVLFAGIAMSPRAADPGWPDALILPQHETERLLAERAGELGVPILWSTELVHLLQDRQGVAALLQHDGQTRTVRADYVAGCDGGHSSVRRLCGARFEGDDPSSHWLVADVQLASPPDERDRFGRNLRVGTYQVSLVEPEWFRVSIMKVTPPRDAGAAVTLEELRQAMFEGLGTDYGLLRARWMSRFTDGFRQVDQYRHGRVFLAGDAGHIHAPIGGQGLNLGIQDAVNLGWKLAAVLRHGAADSLLATYHQERHPVAEDILQLARAQTALVKPGAQIEALRQVISKMLVIPEIMQDLAGTLSGLALRYPWGADQHPLVGRRIPNLPLLTDNGETDIFSLMYMAHPMVLTFDGAAQAVVPERWASWVDTVAAKALVDGDEETWKVAVFGPIPALAAAFVRPDGYVAWASPAKTPSSPESLQQALNTWLG